MSIQDSKNIALFLIFLVPFTLLIFDPNVLFPYITTKALIFRVLVSLALPFAFYFLLLDKKPLEKIKNNYLLLALLIYFFIYSLSGFLGLNPYRSFWGNAERMEGIWSLFFYLLYFFVLYLLFSYDPNTKKTIFYSFLIVATLISFLEIYQYFTLGALRPSATLGNPTYIGFFNLLMFFLLLYFYFETKDKIEKPLFLFLAILNLVSLFTSETRGSILALIGGILSFSFYYFLFSKLEVKRKILILFTSLIFFILFIFFLLTPFASYLPGINRLSETLKDPSSVFPRIFAWKVFLDGFKARPIIGYGPETEPIVFFKFFDPKIYEYEAAIFDRPHNKFVQVLVNSGILGIISWFSIFIVFFYYLFKNKEINLFQKASLSGFISAYLIQNFSLFDMQASYLLFFFGLNLISPKLDYSFDREKFIRPFLILIGGLSLIFLNFHLTHYYLLFKLIQTSRSSEKPIKVSEEFLRLSEIAGPFLTEEVIHLSYPYFASLIYNQKIDNLQTIFNFYSITKKAYEKEPLDYRLITKYASFEYYLVILYYKNNLNYKPHLENFQKTIEKSMEIYPKNHELVIYYAQNLLELYRENPQIFNLKDKAINLLLSKEKYFENFPLYFLEEARILVNYDKNLAKEKIKKALALNLNLKNENNFLKTIEILKEINDKETLTKIVKIVEKEKFSTQTQEKIKEIESVFLKK